MNPMDAFVLGVAILMVALFLCYHLNDRKPEIVQRETTEYIPAAAWLRAGIFFCLFHIISWAIGVMQNVLSSSVATSAQLEDTRWWIWVIGLTAFILFAYWGIWAYYTIRFDRKLDLLPQILFGLLWGVSFGQMLLSLWRVAEMLAPGWERWQQALLAYVFIGFWQWFLMDMYWDVYISPEHDSPKSIKIKTLVTHIPNVTLCLIFLALYGNYAVFIALQTLALVGCSINMRMPAPWSREKTPPARREASIFWGIPRCGGYISSDPKNDPYLKAAHLT